MCLWGAGFISFDLSWPCHCTQGHGGRHQVRIWLSSAAPEDGVGGGLQGHRAACFHINSVSERESYGVGGMVWQRERKREEVREGERERESHALERESVISQIHVYSVKLLP